MKKIKTNFSIQTDTTLDYEEAIKRVTELLKKEGFGILTQIDVKETLKKKLNVDFKRYIILGACNPNFAHKALHAEVLVGVFLPCNVIVYEKDEGSLVAAMNPYILAEIMENEKIKEISEKVTEIFQRIIKKIGKE